MFNAAQNKVNDEQAKYDQQLKELKALHDAKMQELNSDVQRVREQQRQNDKANTIFVKTQDVIQLNSKEFSWPLIDKYYFECYTRNWNYYLLLLDRNSKDPLTDDEIKAMPFSKKIEKASKEYDDCTAKIAILDAKTSQAKDVSTSEKDVKDVKDRKDLKDVCEKDSETREALVATRKRIVSDSLNSIKLSFTTIEYKKERDVARRERKLEKLRAILNLEAKTRYYNCVVCGGRDKYKDFLPGSYPVCCSLHTPCKKSIAKTAKKFGLKINPGCEYCDKWCY